MVSARSLFQRQPAPLLGIDISSSSIKLVELGRDKGGRWQLERAALEPLERGLVVDGNIEKFDEVADALRRLVKRSGTRARNVALALPASAVITKRITLPGGLSEQELEVQVESEASQYIPFSLDEVSLDFCVIGPNPGVPEEDDVLIAASRREKVSDRQGLAEAAGLKAVILDIESYAARLAAARVTTALPQQPADDALVALFELGGTASTFQVMRGDEVLYEREQPFGGHQLTQLVVRQYGFSSDEAELKKRTGDLPDDYGATVLEPFVTTMADEVARSLQFFYSSTPFNHVDHILLAGGTAALPGLEDAVRQRTGVPSRVVNPFEGMDLAAGMRAQRLGREAPSYLTACGLAMRRFLP